MEGAVLSAQSNNRFRTHLKNAASALCARTLPKQRCSEAAASSSRHHTYPRSAPPKRAPISCRMEPLLGDLPAPASPPHYPDVVVSKPLDCKPTTPNGMVKLKGALAREVASAWECRVGPPDRPAPAHRVQGLFNDIELYPTKTQVFEMLVCARQCARRKSLILTFGEFCVFAAELRRCSRQARQVSNKPDSPVWTVDKDLRDKDTICKHMNGSEASPPPCEVFLGGSCNPTTWRSDIAIPMLKKMGITYFNPQVEDWSTELMEVEHRAKCAARALLFVLDSETRAVAASVEAAHLAAAPRDLLLVLRPYARHQLIGNETITDHLLVIAFIDTDSRNGQEEVPRLAEGEESRVAEGGERPREGNGLLVHNPRLRAYGRKLGLFIPKNGSSRTAEVSPGVGGVGGVVAGSGGVSEGGDSVLTPRTERRLERLPAMLATHAHHVYLGGSFPCGGSRPEDVLRREGFTYVSPRANDYTRMFSAPARRAAASRPDSPCDKKPRPNAHLSVPLTIISHTILFCQQYSEAAVKDYNRGRHYLVDLARRSSVPVFDNVDDAMLCVVRRLRTEL
ncbi:PREDICTED: uncharacterized protein LOC106116920 [Papilio xuthus]|uniref:Uncharacterized protein LOC106116920 n=1 Tax=Papilio xuthus TaxID=66420 RepID=A0AAJ6Z700_PAPXU|nr:PREDICTED: uncharacterized protein LOC106116920 [Papilio xuthus]